MFDLSWGEIALVGVVALIVIGPKELPGVLRGVGQALGKLRRMASDFQYQFNQALQEAEVDKVKSSINSVTESMQGTTSSFNPIDYAREQIKSAVDDVKAVTQPTGDTIGPPAPPNMSSATPPAAPADPVAAAVPAPPTYTADPEAIQKAFSAPPAETAASPVAPSA
ncbi:Sec-independent protein translocase protein TatB, partial [Phreatobacter sp. AB_2022a]|uniref:Sec-independent protein translocase protein TatB n=1 Tax=Phreatobacter sp. AB_2022a TaxID=3003134 RepID=UPI002286CFCE